jgi:hypothetical protein
MIFTLNLDNFYIIDHVHKICNHKLLTKNVYSDVVVKGTLDIYFHGKHEIMSQTFIQIQIKECK